MKQSYSDPISGRIVSGLWWGMLWTAVVMLGIFMVFPIFSLPLLGVIACICILTGIALNMRVTEQACPSCGTVSRVMPTGSKCPSCGHSLN